MGKSSAETTVYEYAMSMHIGICAYSPGLELLRLKIGDKEAWEGSLVNEDVIAIDKPELFGGIKKEGGVRGLLWWLPGKTDQQMEPPLAERFGLTRTTSPGYRGWSSIFLTGPVAEASLVGAWKSSTIFTKFTAAVSNLMFSGVVQGRTRGFYLGANNPYLRAISARVRRAPIGLNPAIALIRVKDDSLNRAQYAANPAHIVYECLTNTVWGMGENPTQIDVSTFEACASTLYSEAFGLNMIWMQQSEIGQFIGEVLDHIQAVLYVDPTTGLHTMRLLRDDYNPDTLPFINPSNAKLSNFKRKAWGEIVNEVTVTYTEPETGKEASVTAQDLAGIAAQGGVVATSRNYYGIAHPDLAARVADRDLAASVNPIATCDAEVTRAFWDKVTSDVLKLSWPDYGIDSIIFRISNVRKSTNTVSFSLYEDIFGLDKASYLVPNGSGWVNPNEAPAPLTNTYFGTAPAFMQVIAQGKTDASELQSPEAMSLIAIGADSVGDIGYELTTWFTDVNGTAFKDSLGTRTLRGFFYLASSIPAESETTLSSLPNYTGPVPNVGDFIVIGGGDDTVSEIATVLAISPGAWTLKRGALDTIPKPWIDGTQVWVIPVESVVPDQTVRSVGEVVSYWPQGRTTLGVLDLALTPEETVTLSNRAYKPLRPANVTVNGVAFGTVNATAATNITVTWANRNRLLEVTQVMSWTDATVTPESGQTTTIYLYDSAGTLITSFTGLTGTTYTFAKSAFGAISSGHLKIVSVRAGIESLQGMDFLLTI